MRNFLFILFTTAVFFSCSSKDKLPHGILSVSQMKPIMWDLLKAGELAIYDTTGKKNSSEKDSSTIFFDKIFALHHTNKNVFYTSYQYYLQNPAKLNVLMDSLSSFANTDKYSQYMKPPKIPGNQNPQYNKAASENILKQRLLRNKSAKKDSLAKKIPLL